MRTMMRTRKQLVRESSRHVQRIQKTLEDANIKIASVISDVTGVSGRAILRAIIEGRTHPQDLLGVTTGRLKASDSELREALRGRIRAPHRFLLKLHLEQIEALEKSIAEVDKEVGALLEPFRAKCERLTTIPGVSDVMAEVIVSEIGIDMTRFPTPDHLISWAGLCPRNDESAGKRRSTRLRMGAPWLKTNMVQAAWSAARCKTGYLPAQFHRIKSRRGPKKAIIAVAASMLTAAYFIIRDDVEYRDLGATHFQATVNRDKAASRLVKRLNSLGFTVEIKTVA
jgi:transposase